MVGERWYLLAPVTRMKRVSCAGNEAQGEDAMLTSFNGEAKGVYSTLS